MLRYCLDSDVFIQAKNGPYGMDIVPAFWDWLDLQFNAGIIYSSTMVYEELVAGGDELTQWARRRINSGFFERPSVQVQQYFNGIADFTKSRYIQHQAERFLSSADPWVVAHAMNDHSIVITHETLAPANSQKIKIPNICVNFRVDYKGPYHMLRALGARFIL